MALNLEVGRYYVGMNGVVHEIVHGGGVCLGSPFVSARGRLFYPDGAFARLGTQHPCNLLFECDKDGWVKWDGKGECPIPWAKAGEWEFIFRDGVTVLANHSIEVYDWKHSPSFGDIIAFRLIPNGEQYPFIDATNLQCAPVEPKGNRRDIVTLPGPALRELIGAVKDAQVLLERSGDEAANRCVRALDEAINQVRRK